MCFRIEKTSEKRLRESMIKVMMVITYLMMLTIIISIRMMITMIKVI